MRILLIAGVPGTGKTTMGDYLRDKHGFTHINLEDQNGLPNEITGDANSLQSLLQQESGNKVVTWGFGPDIPQHLEIIKLILDSGAIMVWFDGNRDAAERKFMVRSNAPKELLNMQMTRINRSDIKKMYNPIYYNTFDENGNFKDLDEIANDLISICKK